jgi:hypothetical protein
MMQEALAHFITMCNLIKKRIKDKYLNKVLEIFKNMSVASKIAVHYQITF